MEEPFVIPFGRDFAPQKARTTKYGFSAIDEVPLSDLLQNGLEREVSFYTTHTMADFQTIVKDEFYLGNPLLNIIVPCGFIIPSLTANWPKHATAEVDFFKIPEKLWHQFRKYLFIGDSPEAPSYAWHYGTTELRLLRLDLHLKLDPEAFRFLENAFNRYSNNTLPLHLYHLWSYNGTKESMENLGEDGWTRLIEENDQPTKITDVWKDFIVVRRESEWSKVVVGIAGDFHYSDRNIPIREAYPQSEDINGKISAFAEKALTLWKEGRLDYLVMNGDFIDYSSKGTSGAGWSYSPNYENTNWRGFEEAVRILPVLPQVPQGCLFSLTRILPLPFPLPRRPRGENSGLLSNIPVIWNLGDHDRLRYPYPLPTAFESEVSNQGSHYNLHGLSDGEGAELTFPPISRSGERASHVEALRWIFEMGRMQGWPLSMALRVGPTNYNILCLDTGFMKGEFNQEQYPNDPLEGSGLRSESVSALGGAADFNIIVTHAPPVCLPPEDTRHDGGGVFPTSEAIYGTFRDNRQQFLLALANLQEAGKPVLVLSNHVHFGSMYAYRGLSEVETGPIIRNRVARLADRPTLDMHIEPQIFWRYYPCLLITNPPIGPRPTKPERRSGLMVLELGPDGVSKISWEEI
jgi:hypothetical protein